MKKRVRVQSWTHQFYIFISFKSLEADTAPLFMYELYFINYTFIRLKSVQCMYLMK